MLKRIVRILTVFVLVSSQGFAAEKITLKDLSRYEGVWESDAKRGPDAVYVGYNEHRILSDYGLKQQVHLDVDQKTREVVSAYIGWLGVHSSGEELTGLAFSSDGWVSELVCVPKTGGFVTQVIYTGTNGARAAMTFHDDFQSDTEMRGTTKNTLLGGQFSEEGGVSIRKKTRHTSLQDLVDKKQIVIKNWNDTSPHSSLAPLKRLLGHWHAKNADGQESLDCWFEYQGGNKWMIERWKFSGGDAGINVSGIDPISGRLTMWSVGKSFTGKAGRWDELSDRLLGQVEGDARLVRDFTEPRTYKAHWQELKKGSFVDLKNGAYTATLVKETK